MTIVRQTLTLLLLFICGFTQASDKPVLVLFPIEVDEADAEYESHFGSALQEGLQQRYTVFYGPAVEAELEKEYEKIDCDAERCAQNVAIAFNGELVADASTKRLGDGYLLKLVVRNIISGKIEETKTHACRSCDGFAVVDQLRQMGIGEYKQPKIEIFVSSWCGVWCDKSFKLLDSYELEYSKLDISNPQVRKRFDAIGGNAVPILLIGDKEIRGYSEDDIKEALGK